MKKLSQKFSFLTKILLVFGLLISNLSSLSVVFAYEVSEDVVVLLNEELLEISYNQELAEEVEAVNVKVYENYTYSGGLSEKKENVYSLTAEELLLAHEGTLKLSYNSIFVNEEDVINNYELFDGTYSVKVEIVDVTDYSDDSLETTEVVASENVSLEGDDDVQTLETQEVNEVVLAVGTYEKVMEHESGLNIKLYNSNDEEITLVDGKYPVSVDDTKVKVVAKVLSGGLNPTDVFEYDGVEYLAKDLLSYEFKAEKDFAGYLYGEYELPVEVKLLKPIENATTTDDVSLVDSESEDKYEEIVYSDSVSIMYESYDLNASVLNETLVALELGELYLFTGDNKDGTLYSLTEFSQDGSEIHVKSMLDLYNVVTTAIDGDETKTYQLLKDGVNVLEGYDEETATQTLEEYLSSISLDETVVLSISGNGLTITYRVVMVADLNNDNALTQDDLLTLIDQVIGESEVTDLEKSDVIIDEELNILDVLYLKEIIESQSWDASFNVADATLDASLNVVTGDKENLVSGDEFTVEYILSLEQLEAVSGFSGLFEYDKEALELVSVEAFADWLGNYSKESGKFLYFGEESLLGPEEVSDSDTTTPDASEGEVTLTEEPVVVTEDYVLLTAKFRALKAGNHTVTIKENEYFNDNTYLSLSEDLVASAEVMVLASDDNTLSYLEVAGQEITLEANKFDYEITVSNDVTSVDLKYIVTNVAAEVTSTVYPEELAEGNNTVVVTVTSESGVSQDYTITIVREEAPKEETTTQVSNNYYGDYDNDEEEEIIVTPGVEEDDDDKDDTPKTDDNNLSRIVIIILILLVIAGLVYLIFKDDEDDETKKANKDVNKLKKESIDAAVKDTTVREVAKKTSKPVNKTETKKTSSSNKNKKPNSKKKER